MCVVRSMACLFVLTLCFDCWNGCDLFKLNFG
jgi:hypothetical protein